MFYSDNNKLYQLPNVSINSNKKIKKNSRTQWTDINKKAWFIIIVLKIVSIKLIIIPKKQTALVILYQCFVENCLMEEENKQ